MPFSLLKIVKFGVVGIAAVVVYAVLAYAFIWGFGMNEILASTLGYILAIPVSFFGQKHITFNSKGAVATEAPKFIVLQLFCLTSTIIISFVTSAVLNLHPNIGILAVCVLIPPISYAAMSLIIFVEKAKV